MNSNRVLVLLSQTSEDRGRVVDLPWGHIG